MWNRGKGWTIVVMTVALSASLVSLAVAQRATPAPSPVQSTAIPRIAGKPDFSGIWQANNTANWDLQTHQARPLIAQPGFLPNSVVLAAPVVGLGTLGWVPGGAG